MKPLPFASDELQTLTDRGLRRRPSLIVTMDGVQGTVDGREATLFCSNDYLGLRRHPAVVAGARHALENEGAGGGSSRLITGTLPSHLALEHALAERFSSPACLLFSSGYHANLALLTALCGAKDRIASDSLNHASLIDGCRLSRAQIGVYPHGDIGDLNRLLDLPARRHWVVTESLFSMDGDLPDLAAITALASSRGAFLMVDEAHAFGVLGPDGAGALAADPAISDRVSLRTGTLGKALGSHGAFVLCDRDTRELLLNVARTFVFTTALPPAACGAALASLEVLHREPERRHRVLALASRFRKGLQEVGFPEGPGRHHIVPLILGSPEKAVLAAAFLLQRGIFVQAIRPPTVPPGTSRLRFTFSSDHQEEDVDRALSALLQMGRHLEIIQ